MADMATVASESIGCAMQFMQDWAKATAGLQQEFVKGLREALEGMTLPAWRQRADVVLSEIMALSRTNAEEALQAMEQNFKAGMELWRKAVAARLDESRADPADDARKFCQAMLDVVHTNTEAVMRSNTRVIDASIKMATMTDGQQADEAAPVKAAA